MSDKVKDLEDRFRQASAAELDWKKIRQELRDQLAAARAEAEAAKATRTVGDERADRFAWSCGGTLSRELFIREINAAYLDGARRQREADVEWMRRAGLPSNAEYLVKHSLVTPEAESE